MRYLQRPAAKTQIRFTAGLTWAFTFHPPLVAPLLAIFLLLPSISAPHASLTKPKSDTPSATTIQIRPLDETSPSILEIYTTLFWEAHEKSPLLETARSQQQQKAARVYTAWARRLAPAINLDISQTHYLDTQGETSTAPTSDDIEAGDETYSDGDNVSSWDLSLDLPLYRRSVSLATDIAAQEAELAEHELLMKIHELDVTLSELLGAYLLESYRLKNLDNSIALSRAHVRKIRRGYELRDQTKLALLRAEANLEDLETRRQAAEPRWEASYRKLLEFSGLTGNEAVLKQLRNLLTTEEEIAECINILANLDSGLQNIQSFLEDGESDLLARYFRGHSATHKKIILDRQLAQTKAQTITQGEWPELTLQGEYGRQIDTRFEDFEGEGSLSLVFSVPLFTGGTLLSNLREQRAANQQAEIASKDLVKKTMLTIENTKKTILTLQDVLRRQQDLLSKQQEIVRLSKKSYQIKQTSMQDLLTATNRVIDIKNAIMSTITNLGVAIRKFSWLVGSPPPLPGVKRP